MIRLAVLGYAVVGYLAFNLTFLYLVGFSTGWVVPKTVDSGPTVAWPWAVAVNLGLIALFALQHTVMARRAFKQQLAKLIPPAAERTTFLLATCTVFALLFALWQPIPTVLWHVADPFVSGVILAVSLAAFLVVPAATFMLDHFEFTGLKQAWRYQRHGDGVRPQFRTPGLYRWVRHPMLAGLLVAFWATPTMTVGHLLLAAGMSVYIAMGVRFEERDLVREFGSQYAQYQATTPMLLPVPKLPSPKLPETV